MSRATGKNWLEWVVFGVGLLLLVGTVGYLAVEAAKPSGAPSIRVTFGTPERGASGYIIPVELTNTSAEAAEAVTVEAALEMQPGAASGETARITLAYLPGHSRRAARLEFRQDPRNGKLVVRSLSYAMP